jgi:hypothetical protein
MGSGIRTTPAKPLHIEPLGQLVDPINNRKAQIPYTPRDILLDPYPLPDRIRDNFYTTLVRLPKVIAAGLRGDRDYNFSDFLALAKVPYWLGGIGLIGVFSVVDRIGLAGTKAGVAVALYMGGKVLADKLINGLFKVRYGIDLDLMYRDPTGRIEKAYASTEFPRTDLLTAKHYNRIADKIGIPRFVSDRTKAVKEQIPLLMSQNRVLKLVLGNALAMLGAGYFSRSDAWTSLLKLPQEVRQALFGAGNGGPVNRVVSAGQILLVSVADPFKERLFGMPGEAAPWLRRSVLGVLGAGLAFTVWQGLNVIRKRQYEPSASLLIPANSAFTPFLRTLSTGGSAAGDAS